MDLILALLIFLLLLLIAGFVVYISLYNGLVGKKNTVDEAFSSIDVILKKRCDLIPNLVAVAQQTADFESETLTRIAGLRSRALSGSISGDERVDVENQITREIGSILVQIEAYPNLKANQNFLQLQASLNEVEEQLSATRRFFNSAVTGYNNAIEMFPTNVIASQMNYRRRKVFEATEQDRQNVDVQSLFNR